MPLPGLDIKFSNGNLGRVTPLADGVFGLICSAVSTADFELDKAYPIRGMADVVKLGILPDTDNYVLHKKLDGFYQEAGEGTKLWIMGMEKSDKPSDWFKKDDEGHRPATKLVDASNGEISLIFTGFSPDAEYSETITDGVDSDLPNALSEAEAFAQEYLQIKQVPLLVMLEAYGFNGNADDLTDFTEKSYERVAVFIGDTEISGGASGNKNTAAEVLAGRLASIQVMENPGKVKLGPLKTLTAFIEDVAAEDFSVIDLHEKGYISFRTHPGKAGYYITDDPIATDPQSDYAHITLRRTIDKAYRIAREEAAEELLNDFDVTNEGKISPFYARAVEARIETAIFNLMSKNGELSIDQTDKDDLGVKASFDTEENVVQTDTIKMKLRVRPKGYARWFIIDLGFDVNVN